MTESGRQEPDESAAGEPGLVDRADAFQRRHPWVGYPLAVVFKYFDDQGPYQAALITYYGFVSLFPLLLVFVTTLGLLLEGHPGLRQHLVDSAIGQFPVIGARLRDAAHPLHGSVFGLVLGAAIAVYGGLGIGQALQYSANRAWNVPRGERPDPFRSRGRGLLLLLIIAGGIAVAAGASALMSILHGAMPGWAARTIGTAPAIAADTGLFLVAFQIITSRGLRWSSLLPGAFAAACTWQAMQWFGGSYLRRELARADELYGLFGIVLAMLAWIYLESVVILLIIEAMAVHVDRLWPRALLTTITDQAPLTRADRRAYRLYARSQRFKGHERIEARFDDESRPHD